MMLSWHSWSCVQCTVQSYSSVHVQYSVYSYTVTVRREREPAHCDCITVRGTDASDARYCIHMSSGCQLLYCTVLYMSEGKGNPLSYTVQCSTVVQVPSSCVYSIWHQWHQWTRADLQLQWVRARNMVPVYFVQSTLSAYILNCTHCITVLHCTLNCITAW